MTPAQLRVADGLLIGQPGWGNKRIAKLTGHGVSELAIRMRRRDLGLTPNATPQSLRRS